MELERIILDHVDTPPRLRAVDADRVTRLAESIKAIGLQTPITVWSKPDDAFQLVAGAHRLEAARSLGWEWIDAFFMSGDEIDRQLWEIDENLMRSELTPTEQAEHLAKRKELWEARENQVEQLVPPEIGYQKPPPQQRQFAADTAEATGTSRQQINRAVSRAEKVCDEARDIIRGTKLDTGVFLDKLKSVEPDFQVDFAKRHLARIERPPASPKMAPDPDNDLIVKERQVNALMLAWNKAGREAREEFMARIDTATMDRRYG